MHDVRFAPRARRDLRALPRHAQNSVLNRADLLGHDPRPHGCKKLSDGDGLYRVRVGDYRIIYAVDDKAVVVLVVRVRHRSEAYRP